jgi:hypothetical protein
MRCLQETLALLLLVLFPHAQDPSSKPLDNLLRGWIAASMLSSDAELEAYLKAALHPDFLRQLPLPAQLRIMRS